MKESHLLKKRMLSHLNQRVALITLVLLGTTPAIAENARPAAPLVGIEGVEEGAVYHEPVTPEVVIRGRFSVEEKSLNDQPYDGSKIAEQGLHTFQVTVSDPRGREYTSTTRFIVLDPAERGPTYTVDMVDYHVRRLAESPYVGPTASADDDLVIGRSSGWPEDPQVPAHDLYGFRITDPAEDGPKLNLVLVSGNHPREQTGSWALHGALDFLVSDDPRAAELRRWATFYVYPMVNPDGRYLVSGRSNPEMLAEDVRDHNRVWNTSGRFTTTDIFVESITGDTGGSADYLLDFHSAGSTFFYAGADLMDSAYARTMTAREPDVRPRLSAGHPGMTRLWAMSEEGLNAPFAFTPELAGSETARRSMEIGRSYMLAFHDLITGQSALTAAETVLDREEHPQRFPSRYRARVPELKENLQEVLADEAAVADQKLDAVYALYDGLNAYRDSIDLADEALDMIAAARERLDASGLTRATWITETLPDAIAQLSASLSDSAADKGEVRAMTDNLSDAMERFRVAAAAEDSADVAKEIADDPATGFARLYRQRVQATSDALAALLEAPGTDTGALREAAAHVDESVASYWRVRALSTSPPVRPFRVSRTPEVIELARQADWQEGLLVGVGTADDELVPADHPVLAFDGDGDHVETGFHPGASLLGQAFTWEFWKRYRVFADDTGSSGTADTTPRFYTQLTGSDGGLRTAIGDSYWTAATLDEANRWYHVAIAFDHGEVRTYVDGELRDTRTDVVFSGDSPSPFAIGRGYDGERWLDGYTREHRIWKTARTAAEIRRNRYRRFDGSESGLAAYWPLDDGHGETARDHTGNTNDGSILGPAWRNGRLPGYRLSQPIALDDGIRVRDITLSWDTGNGDETENPAVVVRAGISHDETHLPDEWNRLSNGGSPSFLEEGGDFAGSYLWIKQELHPGDPESPVRLQRLSVTLQ